jgi:predicted O-linked N-acetylglucosamine transferase (SPINDLY family)
LCLLAEAARERGELDRAAELLVRAAAGAGRSADLQFSIGVSLHLLGRLAEAARCYQCAIELSPGSPPAGVHNNLGVVLQGLGRTVEAVPCLREAVKRDPESADAMGNLGNALRELGRLDEAIEAYQRACALQPESADLLCNLAVALTDAGEVAEAVVCYDRTLQLAPGHVVAGSGRLFTKLFLPGGAGEGARAEHEQWARRHAAPLAPARPRHDVDRTPGRRLRVGYVSPNFTQHAVGRLILPLLKAHDHAAVEVFCYTAVSQPDAITEQARACADAWRETRGVPDERLAAMIRADRIDVLVDLTMHMAGSRLLALARRPAPVQVSYLAYCGTTGLEGYRLSDPYLDPPGAEAAYTERTERLPTTYWAYEPDPRAPAVGRLPSEGRSAVTFGSFNNFCKVSSEALGAWCELLRAVPGSRLVLHAHEGRHRQRVRDVAASRGVEPSRIEFQGFLPLLEYLARHAAIDIALDPFAYGGGTTTLDALWMGVPVVSLAGESAVSRAGLSILSNVGLPELVARSADGYVSLAADLARDQGRLAGLRGSLRDRLAASPLIDHARFARDVEAAYRRMWNEWCAAAQG